MSRCNCDNPETCKNVIKAAVTLGEVDLEDAFEACLDSMDLSSLCTAIENLNLADKVNKKMANCAWCDDDDDNVEEACNRKRMESRIRRLEKVLHRTK